MDTITGLEFALAPPSLPFTNGVLAAAADVATVYIWDHPTEGPRLLVIGRRQVVAEAVFRVQIDKKAFIPFRPGSGLANGDPQDVVFAASRPLDAQSGVVIDVRSDGRRKRLGSYNVATREILARDVKPWTLSYGFPLPPANTETTERLRESTALLDNFRALKNNWPQLRPPSITIAKNDRLPVPDLGHRQRIGGKVAPGDLDGSRFLTYGYVQCKSLFSIAEVYGSELSASTTTLDWGVGCGRIARHIPPLLQPGFAGIDVDPVNIEWCRTNIPHGTFKAVDPYRKTEFADRTFDLIYSLSVLTHLSEGDQFRWLEELARISRGLIILSVSGLFGTQTTRWSRQPDKLWKYVVDGFNITETALPDLQDVTPDNYYRSTSHTPAYIYDKWAPYVDVIDIIPAGVGTKQDAVICRPKARA